MNARTDSLEWSSPATGGAPVTEPPYAIASIRFSNIDLRRSSSATASGSIPLRSAARAITSSSA